MSALPIEFLATALAAVVGVIWQQVMARNKELKDKNAELEKEIKRVETDAQGKFDRMGERFDARVALLMQDVAVLKAMGERK